MTIELGALLGQLQGSQSFERFGSWDINSLAPLSLYSLSSLQVHSSDLGLYTVTNQIATNYLTYNYAASNDYFDRLWFHQDTHTIVNYTWAAVPLAEHSGTQIQINSTTLNTLPQNSDMMRYRSEITISGSDLLLQYLIIPGDTNSNTIYFDDVLTVVDVIELCPERNLRLRDELFIGDHQTIGGANPSYKWGFNKKWSLPLEYVDENQALLLNQWWQDTTPLMFTWDTSDTEQQFIVTMTNNQTPMTQFNQPYHDNWHGTLELSAFDTSLVF
jgi:hypothetical protein